MDGSSGTTEQADRILAMHARLGDHEGSVGRAVAEETGIVVMGRGTRAYAIVAAGAAVEVDDHGRGAVEESMFGHETEQLGIQGGGGSFRPCKG